MTIFEAQSVPQGIQEQAEANLEGEMISWRAMILKGQLKSLKLAMAGKGAETKEYQRWARKAERVRQELAGLGFDMGEPMEDDRE